MKLQHKRDTQPHTAQGYTHGQATLCNCHYKSSESPFFCFWLHDSKNRVAELSMTSCTIQVS